MRMRITGTPTIVIALNEVQYVEAMKLKAERDDTYQRFVEARDKLEMLYQSIAGREFDWCLSDDEKYLGITHRSR